VAALAARLLLPWSRESAPLATWLVESASCWLDDASSSLELASVCALEAELDSELWMLVRLCSSWSTYEEVTCWPSVNAAWSTVSCARAATAALADSSVTSWSLGLLRVGARRGRDSRKFCGMVSTP
jgi:hypothetical protein